MTRAEYNKVRSIKSRMKKLNPSYGSMLTIETSGSIDYKEALHDFYTSLGFHPAAVQANSRYFLDDKERIVYIYGLTFDIEGVEHSWTELYTKEEKAAFEAALC